ncbi:hypothetical protein F0L68_35580 [Solihabitans fulvus]|uniref:Uncharacterized protein n=1 Tax=Solihabitans fulvus TaxID=1892852 RepID=A0A5B2WLT1_9PSEU|nr:hypothetical protein [Solihabitans fulvus]KAA2252375.1 hypothetical protein F0L68_35580 [Solihabitans fulvus]
MMAAAIGPNRGDIHESLLWRLQRLAEAVARDEPGAAVVLSEDLADMLGNASDRQRVERYRMIGKHLIELGQIYLDAADVLAPPTVDGVVLESDPGFPGIDEAI